MSTASTTARRHEKQGHPPGDARSAACVLVVLASGAPDPYINCLQVGVAGPTPGFMQPVPVTTGEPATGNHSSAHRMVSPMSSPASHRAAPCGCLTATDGNALTATAVMAPTNTKTTVLNFELPGPDKVEERGLLATLASYGIQPPPGLPSQSSPLVP